MLGDRSHGQSRHCERGRMEVPCFSCRDGEWLKGEFWDKEVLRKLLSEPESIRQAEGMSRGWQLWAKLMAVWSATPLMTHTLQKHFKVKKWNEGELRSNLIIVLEKLWTITSLGLLNTNRIKYVDYWEQIKITELQYWQTRPALLESLSSDMFGDLMEKYTFNFSNDSEVEKPSWTPKECILAWYNEHHL